VNLYFSEKYHGNELIDKRKTVRKLGYLEKLAVANTVMSI
jgi:hypothetical protein